jgi:hypothetical protein
MKTFARLEVAVGALIVHEHHVKGNPQQYNVLLSSTTINSSSIGRRRSHPGKVL